MIREIQKYATEENITLEVEIDELTTSYNDAFDLVSNDCINLDRVEDKELCHRYDLIASSVFQNLDRFRRADLSPAFRQSTIGANRYEGVRPNNIILPEYATFDEINRLGGTICLLEGAYFSSVIKELYPRANYYPCSTFQECQQDLIDANCAMYAGTDALLSAHVHQNPALVQTRDAINPNFFVWPMSQNNMDPEARTLVKEWILRLVSTGFVYRSFQSPYEKTCQLGFAGADCDLPCSPDHGVADPAGNCICDSTKWTGGDCSIEVMEDTRMIPDWQLAIGYAFFGINLLVVVCCGIWLYKNRSLPLIVIAQPFFLGMILFGCVISTSTILALMQQAEPGATVDYCMASPALYSIGFSITFGTLFAKIRRVHHIFVSSAEMRRVTVTARSTLLDIALVLMVDVVILVSWSILSPLEWERSVTITDKYLEPLESVGMCTSDHWEIFVGIICAFHLVLIGIACYMCFVTRNIPDRFSGGSYAAMAMFSNAQILIVGVPVTFLVGGNTEARFFLQSAIIFLNDLVVVLIIFGSLMNTKRRHSRESVRTLVKQSMGEYMRKTMEPSNGEKEMPKVSNPHWMNAQPTHHTTKTSSFALDLCLDNDSQDEQSADCEMRETIEPQKVKGFTDSIVKGASDGLGGDITVDQTTYSKGAQIIVTTKDSTVNVKNKEGRIIKLKNQALDNPDPVLTLGEELAYFR